VAGVTASFGVETQAPPIINKKKQCNILEDTVTKARNSLGHRNGDKPRFR
jgi:hypothetical protein